MSEYAAIKIILRSGQTIESPILPREAADADLAVLNSARISTDPASVSWASVAGYDIEAVHLESRVKPSRRAA